MSYIFGLSLSIVSVLILLTDTKCVDKSPAPETGQKDLNYCWNPLGSAFYNAFGQALFFFGVIMIIFPSMVNVSNYVRPLMDSHLWHVLEELTFSAFLLHYLVLSWFFASRN